MKKKRSLPPGSAQPNPPIRIAFPDNSKLYEAVTALANAIKASADALAKADISNIQITHSTFNVDPKGVMNSPMISVGMDKR
jgi:hypothetical protein